ncbi:hypothetical protein NECAME_10508 [Necator americanus]|uniref:Uncharacterized protein n=1 Tax=Necator americanus TaxID=51031 RepID=W2TAZ5_NECAM|nr:hypothetical protein NECAME_10508 [Necator americanus]ETN78187.1 hypothetical protein NECAME_10508 [Necator americanus]
MLKHENCPQWQRICSILYIPVLAGKHSAAANIVVNVWAAGYVWIFADIRTWCNHFPVLFANGAIIYKVFFLDSGYLKDNFSIS